MVATQNVLTASILTACLVMLATAVNAFMLGVSLRRMRRLKLLMPGDRVAKITVKRTVTAELAFFVCQLSVLVSSVWACFSVAPTAPLEAVTFYYVSNATRVVVTVTLAACTVMDLLRRRQIHDELGRQQAEQFRRDLEERT